LAATLYPSDLSCQSFEGHAARQWDVLKTLRDGLPDGFCVFHGLHWSRLEAGLTVSGQLQFVILTPSGGLICLLMRTGLLFVEQGRCIKKQGQTSEDIIESLNRQSNLLIQQIQKGLSVTPPLEPILFCPDYKVIDPSAFGFAQERILDATKKDTLVSLCQQIEQAIAKGHQLINHNKLRQFLLNHLNMVPEVGVISHAATQWTLQLQRGLDRWVRQLEFSPFRLRINGIAGCGKTLLSMNQLRLAHENKQRCLYLCYNRPLAAHVSSLCHQEGLKGVVVLNFHALCDRILKDRGIDFSFKQPDAFGKLVELALEQPIDKRWVFDRLVVDEGQDFDQAWMPLISRLTHEGSYWFFLQDRAQNLYGKSSIVLDSGWVNLNVHSNYRNPVKLVRELDRLKHYFKLESPQVFEMEAACPVEGFDIEWLQYSGEQDLLSQTGRAITRCLQLGFDRGQVAVLSMRGLKNSTVLHRHHIAPHSFRHFTGQYNDNGEQIFTEGSILAESVYRFKGQSADAIVLTEVDFEDFDEQAYRKLFVGLTRAKLFAVVVGEKQTIETLHSM
jgi:hypothetical protein